MSSSNYEEPSSEDWEWVAPAPVKATRRATGRVVRHGVAEGFPQVQGRCPACRGASLFLAEEGYVTCSRLDCSDPCAASRALGVEER